MAAASSSTSSRSPTAAAAPCACRSSARDRNSKFQIIPNSKSQIPNSGRGTRPELGHGPRFDLPDALARHRQPPRDLGQRMLVIGAEPEAQAQLFALARIERRERLLDPFGHLVAHRLVFRRLDGVV